jgi:hypothetical protein
MEQQVIYVEVYLIQHYVIKFISDLRQALKLCIRFLLLARCTLYIFIMFMLSSFRDLLQVSGFIDNPVSFTISSFVAICYLRDGGSIW